MDVANEAPLKEGPETGSGAAAPGQAPAAAFLFDAFASYSSDPDSALVRDVEGFLESLHENRLVPPEQRRRLKLCVDGSDFVRPRRSTRISASAADQLVELIQSHMRACRRLILFTGPKTAANPWVQQELEWWVANREPDDILIALTHGDDPIGAREQSFPKAILEKNLDRHLWYDLRGFRRGADRASTKRVYEEERLRLAAALLDVAPQDLIEHWRHQQELTRLRQRRIRLALGAAALGAVGVITFGAAELRDTSGSEQAASRSLASRRLSGEETRLIDAMALSASALALRPGPEATSALVAAMAALPVHLGSVPVEEDGRAADIVRFIGGDRLLLSAGYSGVMRVSDANSGRPLTEHRLLSRPIAIATNADGTLVAIGTQKSLELFEVMPGGVRLRARLPFDERVTAVAFAPDGTLLAGAFSSGRVLRYRPADLLAGGSRPFSERPFTDEIGAKVGIMGLAVRGNRLVVTGISGEIACGPMDTTGRVELTREHESEIFGLTSVRNGRGIFFPDAKGRVIMLDAADCAELGRAEAAALPAAGGRDALGRVRGGYREQRPSIGVSVSADGQLIASGGFDGIARVFSTDALSSVASAVHATRARAVALSSNGAKLAVATEGGTIEIWDLRRTVEEWRLAGIEEIAVDPKGRWMALQRDDRLLELRDPRTGRRLTPPQASLGAELAAAPDIGMLTARVPGMRSASVWMLDQHSPKLDRPAIVRIPDEGVTATVGHIAAGRAGLFTLDGADGKGLRKWAPDGRQLAVYGLPERGSSLALGGRLVAVASGRTALLLDSTRLKPVRFFTASSDVDRVAVSPDGRWLLVSLAGPSEVNLVCSVDTPTRSVFDRLRTLLPFGTPAPSRCARAPAGDVTASAFSGSSRQLALGVRGDAHDKGSLFLLSAETEWKAQQLDDSGRVQTIAFSPDDDLVAFGGVSRTIAVVDVSSGRFRAELPVPNQVRKLAFLPGPDRRIVSLDGVVNGVVRVWDWRPQALVKAACARWPRTRAALAPGVTGTPITRAAVCR